LKGEINMNLTKNVKISTALDYASGTADRNGGTLDMQGFEGVAMIVKTATIASGATTSIKAQQGDESDLSDASDLEDTGITIEDDDDDEIFVIDLYKPEKRYVRLVVDKDGSNAAAESAVYVQYQGRVRPEDNNVDDEITTELHISPDEGTA
jgi:hypothetical protein